MSQSSKGVFVLLLALVLAAPACGSDDDSSDAPGVDAAPDGAADAGPDAAVAPTFRNPVGTADDELGAEVLVLLGAPVEGADSSCDRCHGVTRQTLRNWRGMADQALSDCLTDLTVTDPAVARGMIDCLRVKPADPDSAFAADKLGVLTTAADLPWFRYLFSLAYGDDEGPARHADFVERVGMPRGDVTSIDQTDFDRIAEYFLRGLPRLDALLVEDEEPGECNVNIEDAVAEHVSDMSLSGWRAVNADNGILMLGCGGAATPRDCLAGRQRVADWESLAGSVVRRLADVDYDSSYWTRSSADGRFVGHGVESGADFSAAFVDLQTDDVIPANAQYDPGFFPDNSGFAFQSPAHFCEQSILVARPAEVTFGEPGCSTVRDVGLYQHVGASLGGDYWAVDSQFVSDNGGHLPTLSDPGTSFSATSGASLTPMIHDGRTYVSGPSVLVSTPNQGDAVLSPSTRLLITRVEGPNSRQNGFSLRRIDATPTPDGYDVAATVIARYCVNGGKPGFSYDERWITYHHYVEASDAVELGFDGPDDPAFQPYLEEGASNVYLLDLVTGETFRVTGMPPGQYALYPHFRSDGWIYFMVRGASSGETIAATDAALLLEE